MNWFLEIEQPRLINYRPYKDMGKTDTQINNWTIMHSKHTRTYAHTHARPPARTHARTHTHTHTHTHIPHKTREQTNKQSNQLLKINQDIDEQTAIIGENPYLAEVDWLSWPFLFLSGQRLLRDTYTHYVLLDSP